jgi:hypothetical protein
MKKIIIAVLMLFAFSSLGFAQVKKEQPKNETKGTVSMQSANAKATAHNSAAVAHRKGKAQHKATAKHRRTTKQIKSSKYAKSGSKKAHSAKKLNKAASARSKTQKDVGEKSVRKS